MLLEYFTDRSLHFQRTPEKQGSAKHSSNVGETIRTLFQYINIEICALVGIVGVLKFREYAMPVFDWPRRDCKYALWAQPCTNYW